MRKAEHWVGDQFIVFVSSDCSIRLSGLRKQKETDESLPGGCVGGGGGGFGLFPNVVNAVELTPKSTIKMVKSIVRLPHCVNRFNGCISKCVIIGYVFDSRDDSQKAVEVAPFFTQFYFSRISPEFVYFFLFDAKSFNFYIFSITFIKIANVTVWLEFTWSNFFQILIVIQAK